jgi:TRAP-type C4-dicarboxylate transport system permease large subunit
VLLVVGSMMEGFSAIVILVPLIAPIGKAFGIDPIHLGVLFLANLEVGFLLPPVGLNLFLSSIRFQRPLPSLYRPILPFLLLMFGAALAISYVPWLSTMLLPPDTSPPIDLSSSP